MRHAMTIAALAFVAAACSYTRNPSSEEATVVRPGNFFAGTGTIVAISVLRNEHQGASDPNLYRISVLMDTKGFQTVDTDSSEFIVGQTVNITNDGRIEHVSGTTLNR
jgi:hypothetical protein